MPLLALIFAALILALVDQFQNEGKSLLCWSVIIAEVYLIAIAVRIF